MQRANTMAARSCGLGLVATALAIVASGCDGDTQAGALVAADPSAVLTLDTHVDIPLDFATAATDPLTGDLQVNLTKMTRGGLDAGFFIVYVGQTARTESGYAQAQNDALTKFAAIHRMAEQLYPERIEIAYTAADVERIARGGKLVAAIGVENGYSFGPKLELLDRFYGPMTATPWASS